MSWRDYEILREALETPGLRMTYCEGALELMSPSRTHRREVKQRGAEPDECYC